jgi:hypothetical protein
MDVELDAAAGVDGLEASLLQAAEELGRIKGWNEADKQHLEEHNWAGLDNVTAAGDKLGEVLPKLMKIGEMIGVGGRAVLAAHNESALAKGASRESLGLPTT